MSRTLEFAIWFLTALLQVGVVVCAIRAKSFLQFFPLNFYMLVASLFTVVRFMVLVKFGLTSSQYFYFYYYSDALLTICLFFALMALFAHVFHEMGAETYIRVGAILVLGLISAVSYFVVRQAQDQMMTHFVAKLSQNLYFIGAVITYVLWAAVRKMHETRTQLIQLVLSLGVYFSAYAASWALAVIYPESSLWKFGPYIMSLWLPLAWGYTFLKIPEGARLATARVTAAAR
ncbi:MAG TPA: hypothetical protein VKR82_14165 [Candidatus Acidoferrales bacterium]|nr:hypothetical protein [Candidatus Acidoferrales bacterium]